MSQDLSKFWTFLNSYLMMPIDMLMHFIGILLVLLQSLASANSSLESGTEALYPSQLINFPVSDRLSPYVFIVEKSKRTLSLYKIKDGFPIKEQEFPADLGKKPGPKQKENDHKTPVGIYFFQSKLTQPEIPFDLYGNTAFTTDYPNVFDRREAKTGHGIWLHAVPDNVPLTRGSRGCVVVRNDVIKKLPEYVTLKQTPIIITDEMTFLNKSSYTEQQKKFMGQIEEWRQAWISQDAKKYLSYYDETFRNNDMNFKQWSAHKTNLTNRYRFIKVDFGPLLVLRNGEQVVIRMSQHYESDQHKDFGEKTIHAYFNEQTGFKIIREDWKPIAVGKSVLPVNANLDINTQN